MASKLSTSQLLGFKNFFPDIIPQSKEYYASQIGKNTLIKLSTHFLSHFRHKIPSNVELLQEWFTFNEIKYNQVPFYKYVVFYYNLISDNGKIRTSILSVESFLRLFVWLNDQKDIPDEVEGISISVTMPLFQLYLLFNDQVLANYEIARTSTEKYQGDGEIQRKILSMGFPQNDFLNIDYAQLIVTQFYKAIKLLNFISDAEKYHKLYKAFLDEYYCESKEIYLRSIGAAVLACFKNTKPGWTILNVPEGNSFDRDCSFLEKITVQSNDVNLYEQNDYLAIRSNPLYSVERGSYMVVYDLFLIKKIYTGLIFFLSGLVKNNKSLFNEDFLGTIRNEFSEGILLYAVLNNIYSVDSIIKISGNDFKAIEIEREPDFFVRNNKSILLFESKDFFISGDIKLSYDFNKIEMALKNNRLEKAVEQLIKNIERVLLQQLILDIDYDPKEIIIFPIIIVHDALYSSPALNYWVNYWLEDGLISLKKKNELQSFDFLKIKPLTIIEIDTLILYEENFKLGHLNLEDVVIEYHKYVEFRRSTFYSYEDAEEHTNKSAIPFSEFCRNFAEEKKVVFDMSQLSSLLKFSGIN